MPTFTLIDVLMDVCSSSALPLAVGVTMWLVLGAFASSVVAAELPVLEVDDVLDVVLVVVVVALATVAAGEVNSFGTRTRVRFGIHLRIGFSVVVFS